MTGIRSKLLNAIEIRSSLRYENGLPFIVQRLLDVPLGCGT